MKVDFHYHFYSRIFISLLIFSFGFFLLQKSVDTKAFLQNQYIDDTPIVGWAWNDTMGWIALNCANDFDGDGEPDGNYALRTGSCASPDAWGLKMTIMPNVDHDNDPATPNIDLNYVKGCAWAGSISDENEALPGANYTTPGWICFSDPDSGGTAAPKNGVLMSNATVEVNYCQCSMLTGICAAGSLNAGKVCSSFNYCSGGNLCNMITNRCLISGGYCDGDNDCGNPCIANTCLASGGFCNNDNDCEFACENPDPYFLLKGVCFDNSPEQTDVLNNFRGHKPPFDDITAANSAMTSCYLNKDCPDNTECVFPQASLDSSALGTGACYVRATDEPAFPVETCAYDFDCGDRALFYCGLNVPLSWLDVPDSCDLSICKEGYEPYNYTGSPTQYINALNPYGSDNEGYASIVKMESVTTTSGYNQANRLAFPIKFYIDNEQINTAQHNYDSDNPNLATSTNNPLRGCFNCYREKIYECATSGGSCRCDQNVNSCSDSASNGCIDDTDICSVVDLLSTCENCQEYFYYPTDSSTCQLQPDTTCTTNAQCLSGDNCVSHQAGDLKKVLSGFNCTDCTIESLANSCTLNASGLNNNRCSKCEIDDGTGVKSTLYRDGGVIYDNQHGRSSTSTLCGWGYNAWSSFGSDKGFGWFNFSPRISTSTKPYFSVDKGNIYSKSRIVTLYHPPFGKFNASYLIESGGSITNFVSDATTKEKFQGELADRPLINFLSLTNPSAKYTNALGKLDYKGLITVAKTVGGIDYNKYGGVIEEEVIVSGVYADNAIFSNPFNNKVFHITGVPPNFGYGVEFGNGTDLSVKCGDASFPSGAGIIVVEGNMKIKNNIRYDSSCTINNLKQIPSLVWIVKGDVMIDATTVSEIAGTFIILGDGGTDCSVGKTLKPPYQPLSRVGCGQFKSVFIDQTTGAPWSPGNSSLTVSGNVLARNFVLARTKTNSSGDPAEKFMNDGRLQSNPPLGLTDMSKVIPRFSSY